MVRAFKFKTILKAFRVRILGERAWEPGALTIQGMKMERLKKIINYLSLEEFLNAITHGIGAVLAVVGFVALIIEAYLNGGKWHLVSFLIYGISLILLYVASTLYHSFKNEKIKGYLKIFDHSAIYLLIAGNYTPFVLVPLHGVLGWSIFGIVWGMALIGIVFKLFFAKRFKFISTICYLIMGWFAVVMIKPLLASLPIGAIYWLLLGGITAAMFEKHLKNAE